MTNSMKENTKVEVNNELTKKIWKGWSNHASMKKMRAKTRMKKGAECFLGWCHPLMMILMI